MQRLPSAIWIAIIVTIVGGVQQMYGTSEIVLIWCGVGLGVLKILEVALTKPVPQNNTDGTPIARGASGAPEPKPPNFFERVLFAG